MTQYPGYPQQQQPYYAPAQVDPKPTSVKVLAIIGIIWGALQLLCSSISIVGVLAMQSLVKASGQPNPVADALAAKPMLMTALVAVAIVRVVLSLTLLVGSIAALSLKAWGRSAMLAYSWALIAVTIIEFVVSITMMLPAVQQSAPSDPQMRQQMMAQQYGSMFCGPAIALIYPIFVLVYMNKSHVKAAFRGENWQAGMAGYVPPGVYPPGGYPPSGGYPPQQGY